MVQEKLEKAIRKLPAPRKLELGVSEAIKKAANKVAFSDDPVSDKDLVSLLWAADGIIKGQKTTLSFTKNDAIKLYIVKSNGVWLWEPTTRALKIIKESDIRKNLLPENRLSQYAPVHILYVIDPIKKGKSFKTLLVDIFKGKKTAGKTTAEDKKLIETYGAAIEIGEKVEAVQLASAALKMKCHTTLLSEPKAVSQLIELKETQTPVLIQSLGYKPKNLFDIAL